MNVRRPERFDEMFRNPEDRHDNPSWEEIRRDILESDDRIVVRASPVGEIERETVRAAESFATDVSRAFRKEFVLAYEAERAEHPAMSDRMLAWLQERDFTMPTFEILDKRQGRTRFGRLGFAVDKPADAMILFQLPAPLAHYWWKGYVKNDDELTREERIRQRDLDGVAYRWGRIYERTIASVWKAWDNVPKTHGLVIDRVNDMGDHDPKEFYYLWTLRMGEGTNAQVRSPEKPAGSIGW